MKFSIITPSYNQADFLEETIKSIVSQKVYFEYFIQDGGSADDSLDIIKKYAQKYPKNITYVSRKDGGQVNAINEGLKKSKGDIVAYLNSDDYYLPGALKNVERFFNDHTDCKWVVGDCRVSDNKLSWTFAIKHLIPIDIFPKLLFLFNWINQPSVFIRRELVEKVGEYNPKYHYAFDYDYWLRCLKFSKPFRIHKQLSVFRIQSNSKGNTGYEKQFAEDEEVINKYTRNILFLSIHKLARMFTESNYRTLKR
jgi:glycosyltransferase involved in cell wall biosynthesis